MAITLNRAIEHVAIWSKRLKGFSTFWPKHVYHTADASVIPTILSSGCIKPRNQQTDLVCDVASVSAIARNPRALEYSRFYFRPRTLFHIITEGIRCVADTKRPTNQMSIPIILAFDAHSVLSLEGISYTKGKFADCDAERGDDQDFFDSIDFDDIYHDAPTTDAVVRHKRMAEVLYAGKLPLDYLKFIICRTVHDRITLLSLLSLEQREKFGPQIKVQKSEGSYFVHHYSLYITDLKFVNNEVFLKLHHPRIDGPTKPYSCLVQQYSGHTLVSEVKTDLPVTFKEVSGGRFQDYNDCNWKVFLDGYLAYYGTIRSEHSSVV